MKLSQFVRGVEERHFPSKSEYPQLGVLDWKLNAFKHSNSEARKYSSPKRGSMNRFLTKQSQHKIYFTLLDHSNTNVNFFRPISSVSHWMTQGPPLLPAWRNIFIFQTTSLLFAIKNSLKMGNYCLKRSNNFTDTLVDPLPSPCIIWRYCHDPPKSQVKRKKLQNWTLGYFLSKLLQHFLLFELLKQHF